MENVVRKLAVCCLLLFAFAGTATAQNDPLHVIKKGDHYLAHVYDETAHDWVLQDAASFDPATCLWHSGNTANVYGLHHNYYFIDGNGNYRFLAAPLQPNGQLSLSATMPSIQLLRNTDQIYYFYDWDPDQYGAGVARGHRYQGVNNEADCGEDHSWDPDDQQCWEVYWVEYNGTWQLSSASSYHIPTNGARFRAVTITEYDEEISNESGGLGDLVLEQDEMVSGSSQRLEVDEDFPYSYDYRQAYTVYLFEGTPHYFYGGSEQSNIPGSVEITESEIVSYLWEISGQGAQYLTLSSTTAQSPTLSYNNGYPSNHQTAVISLTVTYTNGSTQTRSAVVTLKTQCHNPGQAAAPVVAYEGVTVSWLPTAESYIVSWKKQSESAWNAVAVGEVTSYFLANLDYDTDYEYKVEAACATPDQTPATIYSFHTKEQPGLMVYGAVFGGGRMGDVVGNTQVAIINCDSIHAVYGGNDIAETVFGEKGATITIGVEADDSDDFDDFGTTNAPIRIGDVYGGGNGYYAYNGTSFEPASYDTEYTIPNGDSIVEMTQLHQLGVTVWTNEGFEKSLVCPTIKKSKITVTNDYVKIDSVFGGAKNAILNATSEDVIINIHGGTIFTVFGGNNYGGSLGYNSQEYITVTNTTTETGNNYHNGVLGRDFGIGYLFGGGNKVQGQNAYITIEGGQCDTIFGGGNEADVRSTEVLVNCQLGALADGAYGKVYTDAINDSYSGGDLTEEAINTGYTWIRSGIYNVRTLFGGNNRASMEGVPNLTLTSGGIGTVYGGGNEGDMLAQEETRLNIPTTYGNSENVDVKYSTHVQMNSPNILIDYLYGGCQKSNVDYSTWTEIMDGHVGTVYGGCNISGDVGSARVNPNVPSSSASVAYQEVQGGTYVKASGGVVYNNLFGGSNGFYHCNDGVYYIEGVTYCPPENYVGWAIPTHNETHAIVTGTALIKGNVYAGGNMAPVGFTDATVGERTFPQFVGLASLRMDGGEVIGNVFGGGNMASILGSNEVMVSGGRIGMTDAYDGALYGGNDRSGQAGQISNRVFPVGYDIASDGYTSLSEVNTYVSLTGKPDINTVYGGGNGDYDYVGNGDPIIPAGMYCSYDDQGQFNDKPIQTNTFVDINITGNNNDGTNGGHINTVYGGGNGVTVYGSITVFLNVKDPIAYDHVGTIFGGNNKDNVVEFENVPLVPDIILLHGQVGTVYGGCNRGAMTTGMDFTIGGNTYRNVGSMVRLRSSYQATSTAPIVTPDAVVSQAVYGGCCMNDVDKNSLVIVEGGSAAIPAKLFGGCDISGAVGDTSRVVVTDGTLLGDIYAGGNGNYYYKEVQNTGVSGTHFEVYTDNTEEEKLADSVVGAPICRVSRVDLLGGNLGSSSNLVKVFGGGYGQPTQTTGDVIVNVGPATATSWTGLPVIYGDIYGGSAYGDVNTDDLGATTSTTTSTTVNFLNGTLRGDGTLQGKLFGGGLGRKDDDSTPLVNESIEAKNYGKVFVNISSEDQPAANCYIDLRNAEIYGCNNQNGSPQDDVTVHVWKTAYVFTVHDGDKYKATYTGPDALYAINQVFGGGNQANYSPMTGENPKKILVHVHECLNTIRRVFAGGNAANATKVSANIEGGRMDYVFGGGNGEVTAANIGDGGTNTVVSGGIINALFGGSNQTGSISGPMYTEVNKESGCDENITDFFGGCNLAELNNNDVYSIIKCDAVVENAYGGSNQAEITGNITFDVRGGTITNVFGGSKGVAGTGPSAVAANINGNVTLNLEGGHITNAFGGCDQNGNITDNITVNVIDFELEDCGLDLTNVYGGGKMAAYTPTDATSSNPVVNVMNIAQEGGITGNVFGGAYGATATVTANPTVNFGYIGAMSGYLPVDLPDDLSTDDFIALVSGSVYGGGELAPVAGSTLINVNNGTVVHKVVGGGKQADISANTEIYIKGGNIGTDGDAITGLGKGIYGGCDQSGNVGGNALVEITGGTIGVSSTNTANIHGGGYGEPTTVTGNVTVNFGDNTNVENTGLVLYGELYGGSALGDVNTADQNNPGATTTTTVNLRNGIINGAAYGGGLGQKAGVDGATTDISAYVYGKVHVTIGYATNPSDVSTYTGQANLVNCDVYGCNNLKGSPSSNVYVDVYHTAHNADNVQSNLDGGYAIRQVFGGGNRADYIITSGESGLKNTVNVYGCENTIGRLFGGGNAAAVYGVNLTFDGGRFDQVFGGGNGELGPDFGANILEGGINILIGGGFMNLLFNGSNMYGTISGDINVENYEGCGEALIIDHYMGSNQADIFHNITETIRCETDPNKLWRFVNLYCGSNKAQIYGDINLTIEGGIYENVFGGSKGSLDNPATDPDESFASNVYYITQEMIDEHEELTQTDLGRGGNINLFIYGGTIGDLYGACDINGNVEGRITITVQSYDNTQCPLFIGNIYGGGNRTNYTPFNISNYGSTEYPGYSPLIKVLKATVGGDSPYLPVIESTNNTHPKHYEGNVFGGGNRGKVTASPMVLIGPNANMPVYIKGSVYGGGNEGDVEGSPKVIVGPDPGN